MIDSEIAYNALVSRDRRFDGIFFVAVTSTKIYCRPICPAKTPMQKNCRFFETAAAAEQSGFRPCLRCRPELAPGTAPIDNAQRVAHLIVQRTEQELTEGEPSLEKIARQFDLSSRQLRRIVQNELGVSPISLLQTRRLLLARQLLTETKLPIIEVAFASGYSSLRRFNDAFNKHYKMPPSRLRKAAARPHSANASDSSTVQLTYRPPYAWEATLDFLRARKIKDVEHVTEDSYARTVRLGKQTGWIRVAHSPQNHCLTVTFAHSLTPVLPALLGRLRDLFDLAARPALIANHLRKDKRLACGISKHPGLRVPGAFDGFEMAVRAILGQQITVKAATTIACRFAQAFGEEIQTPFAELSRLSPMAVRVSRASVDDIAKLGIVGTRARSIIALAKALVAGELRLDAGANPLKAIEQLVTLPGVGQWTAHYIAMRALRWPDAFPKEDIAVRNNLGGVSARQAEELSQPWRPWRSYAVMHIWKNPAVKE
jgi:AraC family transcriptional regulator of adaptative response / DNA-3-methyladenine glycosylase II